MFTALIITAMVFTLILAALALTIVTGAFPRLAAVTARVLEPLFCRGEPTRLTPRERYELVARLWVP